MSFTCTIFRGTCIDTSEVNKKKPKSWTSNRGKITYFGTKIFLKPQSALIFLFYFQILENYFYFNHNTNSYVIYSFYFDPNTI